MRLNALDSVLHLQAASIALSMLEFQLRITHWLPVHFQLVISKLVKKL